MCEDAFGMHTPPSIHHLRAGVGMGQRSGDDRAIPLCPTHHQFGGYGVAFHAGKKAFEKKYGTEEELLTKTHARIKELLGRRATNNRLMAGVIVAPATVDPVS